MTNIRRFRPFYLEHLKFLKAINSKRDFFTGRCRPCCMSNLLLSFFFCKVFLHWNYKVPCQYFKSLLFHSYGAPKDFFTIIPLTIFDWYQYVFFFINNMQYMEHTCNNLYCLTDTGLTLSPCFSRFIRSFIINALKSWKLSKYFNILIGKGFILQ